jgi:hypothetical protein
VDRIDPDADQVQTALHLHEPVHDPGETVHDPRETVVDALEPILDSREPSGVVLLSDVEKIAVNYSKSNCNCLPLAMRL